MENGTTIKNPCAFDENTSTFTEKDIVRSRAFDGVYGRSSTLCKASVAFFKFLSCPILANFRSEKSAARKKVSKPKWIFEVNAW